MGDDRDLERKVRRHGNLAENAAIFVVVLALAEMIGTGSAMLWALGLIFLVGRSQGHMAMRAVSFYCCARYRRVINIACWSAAERDLVGHAFQSGSIRMSYLLRIKWLWPVALCDIIEHH